MSRAPFLRIVRFPWALLLPWLIVSPLRSLDDSQPRDPDLAGTSSAVRADGWSVPGIILCATTERPWKLSRLRVAASLEGRFMQPAYSRDREVIPAGSRVRLVIDKIGKAKVGDGEQEGALEGFKSLCRLMGEWRAPRNL